MNRSPAPDYRGWLREIADPETILWDGCDAAIVGVVETCGRPTVVAYDYELLVGVFVEQGMTEDEAGEHVDLNIVGQYVNEHTPVVLMRTPWA